MKLISKILLYSSGIALLGLGSCKKSYLDRMPSNEVPTKDAFKTTGGCKAALEGIHSLMFYEQNHDEFGQKSIDLMNDLMGDDMPVYNQGAGWFVNSINYTNARSGGGYIWGYYYMFVLNCNEILAHVDSAVGPQSDKNNIKGQTYFYLAYAYYNLSIYYQHTYLHDPTALGIPIYHTVTQTGNPREPLTVVYKEILNDLDSAAVLLDPNNGAPQRPNKSEINIDVVHGLLARVDLVMGRWQDAYTNAGLARQNYPYMSRQQLLDGFNDWSNPSWIWGSHLNTEQDGIYASFLSQMDVSLGGYAALGQQKLVNNALFSTIPSDTSASSTLGYDVRRDWWYANQQSPFQKLSQRKFRAQTPGSYVTDVCYMRAAEMGFIQAEAQAQLGNLPLAEQLLNEIMIIRNPKYDAASVIASTTLTPKGADPQQKLLIQIWHQRRIELWGEGFRYSDLQRCAKFPASTFKDGFGSKPLYYSGLHREYSGGDLSVYGTMKEITDPFSNQFLYRIPISEMNYNPNMVQNP